MAHSQDIHSADFGHEHQAHEHEHAHDLRKTGKRTLVAVLVMLSVQLTIEIIGGIMSGSLGLLAHATHMITDAVAVALALFAMWIAERPATISRTFGFHRTEVLVVLFNALALWVLASWILYEAYGRFTDHTAGHGHEVEGSIMLIVAIGGLAINSTSAWILYRSSSNSINIEGVFWHIMADLMGSIAVVISAVITLLFDWDIVDPILSVVIAALILGHISPPRHQGVQRPVAKHPARTRHVPPVQCARRCGRRNLNPRRSRLYRVNCDDTLRAIRDWI